MNFRSCSPLIAASLTAFVLMFVQAQSPLAGPGQPRQNQAQQQPRQGQAQRQRQLRQGQAQGQRQGQQSLPPRPAGREKELILNDKGYFERPGVNVLVFSNAFTGGFNDEKNSGIEIIHHGVRTVQGGAVRLCKTPEQWDLVPASPSRRVTRRKIGRAHV